MFQYSVSKLCVAYNDAFRQCCCTNHDGVVRLDFALNNVLSFAGLMRKVIIFEFSI